jgi:hypothetical protein
MGCTSSSEFKWDYDKRAGAGSARAGKHHNATAKVR